MTCIARILLVLAFVFTLVMALQPDPPPAFVDSDKLQHVAAFFTLAVLGRLAFPQVSALGLFAALALLGAGIELVQLIPALERSGDPVDWLADLAAAAMGLLAGSLLHRLLARA